MSSKLAHGTLVAFQLNLLLNLLAAAHPVGEGQPNRCCGYIITNRNDAYFGYEYRVDFSSLEGPLENVGWNVSDGTQAGGKNPFTGQVPIASAANVELIKGEGLALKVPVQAGSASELTGAEVVFSEATFGGIFQAEVKVTDTPGTCMGIFTSAAERSLGWNDEQDIEILGASLLRPSDVQPSGFQMVNWDSSTGAKISSNSPFPPDINPSETYNPWEIAWFPQNSTSNSPQDTQIRFNRAIVTQAPREFPSVHPSVFVFNHWTNGDSAWSGGPPSQDAIMYVKRFVAYYDKPEGLFEGSGVSRRRCDRAKACRRTIGY